MNKQANLDRLSEKFNDVDTITGRPFSLGHPDGVWMVSIIYGMFALASLVGVVFSVLKIFSGDFNGFIAAITGLFSAGLFLATIYFLFTRSIWAIVMSIVITAFAGILVLWAFYYEMDIKYYFLIVLGLHVYTFFYTLGLQKDKLIY